MISSNFLHEILVKYCPPDVTALITDMDSVIQASTVPSMLGSRNSTAFYIAQSDQKSALIDNSGINITDDTDPDNVDKKIRSVNVTYGSVLSIETGALGILVVTGPRDHVISAANIIKAAVESASEYDYISSNLRSTSDSRALLARTLLDGNYSDDQIISQMNKQELDSALFRSVILISVKQYDPKFFNINLNLGYKMAIDKINHEVLYRIRTSRFINSQDLMLVYDQSNIMIIKSFIRGTDLSKAYLALDVIMQDLQTLLDAFTSFSFHIAYGNLYNDIHKIPTSCQEARKLMGMGMRYQPDTRCYRIDDLLFNEIASTLHPQIISKILKLDIMKLSDENGEPDMEIINTAEAFVDNNMSISRTADAEFLHRNTITLRLKKLQNLTGLNPQQNFQDAFIVKMIALYINSRRDLL